MESRVPYPRVMDTFLRSVLVVVLVAVALVALLYLLQRRMIYFPGPPVGDAPAGVDPVVLRTDDGLTLGAWFVAAAVPAGARSPAVLVCNGNGGDRSHRLALARGLAARGYAVLLFDYRGYAGNPGRPSEEGLRSDARAAADALAARPEVDATRIAYFGESLGAAVAGGLATERPPAALVLRSPPSSIADVARHHYPYLPVVEALLLDRFQLADHVRAVRVATLVLVAEHDEIVPTALSQRVYDAAAGPKRWVALAASHHNDRALFGGPQVIAEVDRWLSAL